ncbi:MAG: hypothetical protein IVW54_01925 [Candidatus Binataceae bacterium]|nr:hypothetical protein [Candidatus Binataceae bacterium]
MENDDDSRATGFLNWWWEDLAVFALFLFCSVIILDRAILLGHCVKCYVGQDTDPPQFMWFLNWWRYAIAHRLNPFWTDLVWTPLGTNLSWTTFVPLPGVVSIPLQRMFGARTAYNILCTLAMPLAGVSAFALCRRVTNSFWPSVLGGYVFGFSPYMLAESLSHLHLVAIFPVPLIALMILKWIDGSISARGYTGWLALLLTAEFLCSAEVAALLTVVAGAAFVLGLFLFCGDLRRRIVSMVIPSALAYVIMAVAVSPYLYAMLAHSFPHEPIWSPELFSADLLGFLLPTETNWIGTARPFIALTRDYHEILQEKGEYLGIALLATVEAYRRRNWASSTGKFMLLLLLLIVIAAMGPLVHVGGRVGVAMPWAIVSKLPILSQALPIRLMLYAFLLIAVITAVVFASWSAGAGVKWLAAAAIIVSILPNPRASFWVSPINLPPFFRSNQYRQQILPGEVILPIPFGARGISMYWQAATNMYFRMAGGYTGLTPFEFEQMPAVGFLSRQIDLPEAGDQLKAYIARFGVQAVFLDEKDPQAAQWRPALGALGFLPILQSGVGIYNIPPRAFAEYGKLSPMYLESRALTLRFDAIAAATGNYLAEGRELQKLSPRELERLNLLPAGWSIYQAPNAAADWTVKTFHGQIVIALLGSLGAVKVLIDRYGPTASEITYPGAVRWQSGSKPPANVVKPMLLIFQPSKLAAIARQLKSSPPPELTTNFMGESLAHFANAGATVSSDR